MRDVITVAPIRENVVHPTERVQHYERYLSWELRVLELEKITRKILTGFFTNSIFVFGLQNQQPSRQRREMKPTPLFNFPTKKFNIPTKISIFPPTSMRTFQVSNIRSSSIATSHLLMRMTQIANHFSHSSTVEVKNGSF